MNGGLYTLKYPYATFAFSTVLPSFGSIREFGPTNATGAFPLAPLVAVSGQTLPLAGLVAILGSFICASIESDYISALHWIHSYVRTKAVIYATIGLISINQLSCVEPSTFLLFSSLLLIFAGKSVQTPLLK